MTVQRCIRLAGLAALAACIAVPATALAKDTKTVQDNLERLHADNQAEIQNAKIAEERASSPEVKQLASHLSQQHTQMDEQLQQFAKDRNLNLEGDAYQKQLGDLQSKAKSKLGEKQGADFDRAYTSLMAKEHQDDVSKNLPKWIKDAKKAGDTQVVSMLENVRSTLQQHQKMSQRIEAAEKQANRNAKQKGNVGGTGANAPKQ